MIILFALLIIFSFLSSAFFWMMVKGAQIGSENSIPERRGISQVTDDNGNIRCRNAKTEPHLGMKEDRTELSII